MTEGQSSHEAVGLAPGTELYLLRHGQTIWNAETRFQGRKDSPLSLRGIAQAQAMGARLAREIAAPEAFAVVSSPLGRAWQTASIVSQSLGLDPGRIVHEPRLAEVAFGAWEGLTRDVLEAADPGIWQRRLAERWTHRPPGGETYAEVAVRVESWMRSVTAGARLVVVGHGLAGRILRGLYLGLPPDQIFALEEPQDALFRLSDGAVSRLPA